jgi:S1-C subfamily serine protease
MQTDLWGKPQDHQKWGREIDRNLFTSSEADRCKFSAHGCDVHSLVGDPLFVDPSKGDFRVREGSPALALGFRNFPMDGFGVTSQRLKRIARSPEFPKIEKALRSAVDSSGSREWRGAKFREMGEMEFSALQVSEREKGVIVTECQSHCAAYLLGLRSGDFVQTIDGRSVRNLDEFLKSAAVLDPSINHRILLRRDGKEMTVELSSDAK